MIGLKVISLALHFNPQIKRQLMTFGIETQDFDVIDHSSCIRPEDSDFKINIDEETLKKILGDAASGFKNVATQVRGKCNVWTKAIVVIVVMEHDEVFILLKGKWKKFLS